MPDWKQIVSKNFRALGVCSPEFTEELAAHLEDCYEALLNDGLPAEMAFQHILSQIEGGRGVWLALRFLKEEFMNHFIREAALPGLLTSGAACFFHWALTLDHIGHKALWLLGGQSPLWWWCLLPVFGALGAILSRRDGGTRPHRIAASLVPSAILGAFVLLLFVVGFTISGFVNHYQVVSTRLELLGIVPPGFALLPAAFSLLGAGIAEVSTDKFSRIA